MTLETNRQLEDLVAKAKSGNKAAYSEIVRMMMRPVIALTHRMVRDREAAIDLAQDTFVTAWEKLSSFRGDSKFETWLFTIATNKSINYLNSAARRTTERLDDVTVSRVSNSNPEDDMLQGELRSGVMEFMKGLPGQQRAVFNLRFYHQMTFEEISNALGKALGTVKTHYREAVKKLREHALAKGWTP
ncbi:MAG: sigma-70 family RNA polymerase sigma factor [Candidatus Zixiibacteriota bacterium]|nr:MAG: sigma-70 family RNA polymerase sigma factor [candidate division Zixibacteria bacterium]